MGSFPARAADSYLFRMPASPDDRRLGLAWALAAAVGGALFVVPWKLANAAGEPTHSVLLLLSFGALVNTGLVAWRRVSSGAPTRSIQPVDLWVAALLAGFTLLGNLASARAIQELSPALLNVLLRAEVVLVAIFAWLLLGERVETRFWLGAVMAALGLVVLQGPFDSSRPLGLFGGGTGMALGAAACFSTMAIVTRHFIHRIEPVSVNALRLWFAVALWFPFNSLRDIGEISAEQVFYTAIAGVVGPFLGRLFLMLSAQHVEARVTALVSLTTPVMTLVTAFVLLSDWPLRHELVGGAIMVAGVAIPLLRKAG